MEGCSIIPMDGNSRSPQHQEVVVLGPLRRLKHPWVAGQPGLCLQVGL